MIEEHAIHPPETSDAFQTLTEPYRRELLVHCYRFLGSLEDAEDALQETLLRAWRRMDTLHDPAALRAWLYRIAANVSLDMIDRRKARTMPALQAGPADPQAALPAPVLEPVWLEPLPDEYLSGQTLGPESRYELRESVSLAFVTLLQQLPARQRAALILHDVLDWKSEEIGAALELSAAAVNSALQRARATLKRLQREPEPAPHVPLPSKPPAGDLLSRYLRAWEAADSQGLVHLLREDAILNMPPSPAWYQGRAAVLAFLSAHLFAGPAAERFRLVPIRANGCPGFAVYQRDEQGAYRPSFLQVLTIDPQGQVARIDAFLGFDGKLFAQFHLADTL